MENPQEKFPYNKENNSYDLERERLKREYDRGFANYERRQEEEEENFKRRERERDRERDRKRDRERERERERNNYYDDERRRDYNRNNYFEEGNRILLRPEKLDIVMNQNYEDKRNNIMNKEDDMGFIKCYVEGYMYLKIKKKE